MKTNFYLSIALLLATSSLFSQVKYTSSGNFGIGTYGTPRGHLHLKNYEPTVYFETVMNTDLLMRFVNDDEYYTGAFLDFDGYSGSITLGIHPNSSSSTSHDKSVLVMSGEDGTFDFYPRSTYEYANTFVTSVQHHHNKCYIVNNSGQTFYVYGNGHVFHNGITDLSDISVKENIKDLPNSLDLIMNLRPVVYNIKAESAFGADNKALNYGLIAQEVEEIIPDVVDTREDGLKGISYNEITALLIDVVQSQQEEINFLKQLVLAEQAFTKKSLDNTLDNSSNILEQSKLFQNTPNPFDKSTVIRYDLLDFMRSAYIRIYNLKGKQELSFRLIEAGPGEVMISSHELSPGIYFYNLVIDSEIADYKKMIITE